MKKTLDKLALIVSALSSPFVVITVFSFLVIVRYSDNLSELFGLSLTFFFFSVIIPFAFIYYSVKTGQISDLHISVRQQRTKPFLVSLLGTVILLGVFYLEKAPREILFLIYILLINGTIFLLITQFWKASIHLAALAGSITFTLILVNPYFAFFFLTVPLVAWARMRRHRHNIWQTAVGAVGAALITFLVLKLARL